MTIAAAERCCSRFIFYVGPVKFLSRVDGRGNLQAGNAALRVFI
jgi:hypothetical protein